MDRKVAFGTIRLMSKLKNPLTLFFATLVLIIFLTFFGPEEKSLGANVRIVYLHGAWVLAAEAAFFAAAIAGAVGLVFHFIPAIASRENGFHKWSAALGRTGIVFWLTYLPLSLWAMEANWNGLFLAEPRFRLALTFAVVGLLLQIGLWIINLRWMTSLANVIFIITLRFVFSQASNIMHPPPSPIFSSGIWSIIIFFIALNMLAWLAAFFLSRWFISIAPE
jgi:hypothetical protein